MRFLNGLFWFLLAVVVAIFTYGNWRHVEINLWSGLIADINLPLLLLAFFLAGFVPMALWHQAVKWRLKQRLATAERSLTTFAAPVDASAPFAPAGGPTIAPLGDPLPTAPEPVPAAASTPAGDLVDRAGVRPAAG